MTALEEKSKDYHKSLGQDYPSTLHEHQSFNKIEPHNYAFIPVIMTTKVAYHLLITLAEKMISPRILFCAYTKPNQTFALVLSHSYNTVLFRE